MTARLLLLLSICALFGVAGCSRTGDDAYDTGGSRTVSRLLPDLPEIPRLSLRREKPDLSRFPPPAPPEMQREPVRSGLIPQPGQRSVNCREQMSIGGRVKMICR